MRPTYDRLITEPLYSDKNSEEYTLRQQFRYYEFTETNITFDIPEENKRLKEETKSKGINPLVLDRIFLHITGEK